MCNWNILMGIQDIDWHQHQGTIHPHRRYNYLVCHKFSIWSEDCCMHPWEHKHWDWVWIQKDRSSRFCRCSWCSGGSSSCWGRSIVYSRGGRAYNWDTSWCSSREWVGERCTFQVGLHRILCRRILLESLQGVVLIGVLVKVDSWYQNLIIENRWESNINW